MACAGARAADPQILTWPAVTDTPVRFTLLATAGKTGRDNPFYDGYRPQLQFSAERETIMCTVRVAEAVGQVTPGQTADVKINCPQAFRTREDRKTFSAFEGGRLVGTGTLP